MKGIMVMGTASDVGKTMICTALCRLFADEGMRVAPFKSQNMSRFSEKTKDGKEMSRAQFLQADAARTEPIVEMNPILLKPLGNMQSEVRFLGELFEMVDGMTYRERFFNRAIETIKSSLQTLADGFDVLVIEGAGSPAEVNLNDREIVNMRVADIADVPVLLVADIDRGGAIASIVGTLALLEPAHRARVKGILINKFHGDVALFQEGVTFIEQHTGIRVVGVLPHMMNHGIEEEDVDRETSKAPAGIDVYDAWAAHVKAHVDWPFIQSLIGEPK